MHSTCSRDAVSCMVQSTLNLTVGLAVLKGECIIYKVVRSDSHSSSRLSTETNSEDRKVLSVWRKYSESVFLAGSQLFEQLLAFGEKTFLLLALSSTICLCRAVCWQRGWSGTAGLHCSWTGSRGWSGVQVWHGACSQAGQFELWVCVLLWVRDWRFCLGGGGFF